MIIEDMHGNIITNPNLEKGRLEKSYRETEEGERYDIYIYFPFSEDEQQAYEVNNKAAITQDKCSCVMYESAKETITFSDTDPFCYSYARRVQREELTINECPQELRERIEELAYPNGDCSIVQTATHCTFNGLEASYKRGMTFEFVIVPENGYRLPYYEELSENVNVIAVDDEGAEIANFFQDNCSWEEVEGNANVTVSVPSNCASINAEVTCLEEE